MVASCLKLHPKFSAMYIPRSLWCFFVSLEEQLRSRPEEANAGASASWLPKVPIQGLVSAFDRGLNRFLSVQEEVPHQEVNRMPPENPQTTFIRPDYGHSEAYIHEPSQLAESSYNYNESPTISDPIGHARMSSHMPLASSHYPTPSDAFSSNLSHERGAIQQRPPPMTSRPASRMSGETPIDEIALRKGSQETLGGKWAGNQNEFHQEEATLYSQHYPNQDHLNMKGNYYDIYFICREQADRTDYSYALSPSLTLKKHSPKWISGPRLVMIKMMIFLPVVVAAY
jgi:hypothetical protein